MHECSMQASSLGLALPPPTRHVVSAPSINMFTSLGFIHLQRLVCPREVVWLNGAPGSGKGTK
jgi:hypothetical protein